MSHLSSTASNTKCYSTKRSNSSNRGNGMEEAKKMKIKIKTKQAQRGLNIYTLESNISCECTRCFTFESYAVYTQTQLRRNVKARRILSNADKFPNENWRKRERESERQKERKCQSTYETHMCMHVHANSVMCVQFVKRISEKNAVQCNKCISCEHTK